MKWAGKPRTLSPLMCARYGWINVGCDMLKCSTCQAFLCATLQPTIDYEKCEQNFSSTGKRQSHLILAMLVWCCQSAKKLKVKQLPLSVIDESRIAEISRQLQTQHEKFCPWPDFPCPGRSSCFPMHVNTKKNWLLTRQGVIHVTVKVNGDVISERFWLVPACEPSALLNAFLERFQSACLLAQQLPAMKPEQLKSMVRQEKCHFRYWRKCYNAMPYYRKKKKGFQEIM